MRLYYTDVFVLPLPEWHRFPMRKYSRLRERVIEGGVVGPSDLFVPPAATVEELLRVHDAAYVHRVVSGTLRPEEVRELGFPWSLQLVERSRRSVGATIAACRSAIAEGVGINLAGGTHHAFRDRGAGYCVFNDAAVGARAMQAEGRIDRVVILDGDVHQGDGTASIFADDPNVFTLSIHGARNYPLRKQQSDLDIELPDKTSDADYLEAVERGVCLALERSQPGLAIYLAGADPFEGDDLGRLAVTKAGLAERDRIVFERCQSANVPVAVAMAGGYSKNVEDIVDIHLQTILEARRRWEKSFGP